MAPAAAGADGYWGVPTATIDWCEENYQVNDSGTAGHQIDLHNRPFNLTDSFFSATTRNLSRRSVTRAAA